MNVGGPTHSVEFSVAPTNGDGKEGCNLTGSRILDRLGQLEQPRLQPRCLQAL